MTAHDVTEREWALMCGISADDITAAGAKARISDYYREVLAEAEFANIGDAILDDLWQEALDRRASWQSCA